ncbi:putative tannase [Bisporella sp. PMI_857]|nr:putative tannase [Bisporella sp. PMI_857]
MHSSPLVVTATALAAIVQAATLNDICTTSYLGASLPVEGFYNGITILPASLTANAVTNTSVSGSNNFPDATFDYCNVTFQYTHDGTYDIVNVMYWLPAPSKFQNRYLSTGGGGLAINSGTTSGGSLPGGVQYGAVSGLTDGGFGGFTKQMDSVFLLANGTVNWQTVFMFGYEAHHELSALGKEFTKRVFNMSAADSANSTKLYSYYQGCSEGGREGWSQIQRFADEWDGAVTGAPAFRFGHQQIQHLYSNVVEQTLGYYPPPCELAAIVNATIAFCDPLDGKTDGVVARTDLCKLQFNINSTIGLPYNCAATTGTPSVAKRQMPPSAPAPAQNGTVSAQAVAVAAQIIDGLHDTSGRRGYVSYQPSATFADAKTQFNSATGAWELSISSFGGEFVTRFLGLEDTSTLTSLDGVTYDTLIGWINGMWQTYDDTLQTTRPDITPFQSSGGKVLHYHGESDDSIPAASSVHYYESVRQIMYPGLSYNESVEALNSWYRLFLVPGAGHCSPNSLQPNGPFPQTNLAVLIDWVENGVEPATLNATYLTGSNKGANAQLCAWPLRPKWSGNGTVLECEYDQASIDTWKYTFPAFKLPVY